MVGRGLDAWVSAIRLLWIDGWVDTIARAE